MWELDFKESWELKNWCFWTVVLEKTFERPLDFPGGSDGKAFVYNAGDLG